MDHLPAHQATSFTLRDLHFIIKFAQVINFPASATSQWLLDCHADMSPSPCAVISPHQDNHLITFVIRDLHLANICSIKFAFCLSGFKPGLSPWKPPAGVPGPAAEAAGPCALPCHLWA